MTQLSSGGTGPNDLHAGELVREAYGVLWRGRGELLRVAALPVVLILFIDVAIVSWVPPQSGTAPGFWFFLLVFLSLLLGALMAVNWLRVLVLGSAAVSGLGARWGWRETRFLLRWIAITLLGFAASLILMVPAMFVMLLLGQGLAQTGEAASQVLYLPMFLGVMVIYAYVALRLCLALVTAAIEAPGTLRDAWTVTRGLGMRLVLAGIPVVAPFYLLVLLGPALVSATGLEALAPLSSLLLQVVLAMLTYAAGFALVSVVYRKLGRSLPQRA